MPRLVIPVLLVVLAALPLGPLAAQEGPSSVDADKLEAIHRLLEVSGQAQLAKQGMLAMIDQIRPTAPELPDEFFDEFKKEALKDELIELLVPVYERHFSEDEIRELIYFYESPIGQKLVERQPLIQQDSMGVGQAWGQRKAAEIVERLQQRGIMPDDESP